MITAIVSACIFMAIVAGLCYVTRKTGAHRRGVDERAFNHYETMEHSDFYANRRWEAQS